MSRRHVWAAAAIYLVLAVAATWPLAEGLARDVAWNLGDPLLNMWIMAWDVEQLKAILGGDVGRLAHFFDANIFYPTHLTLAYSEHLFPQALQFLPVYALTGNPILAYNLVYLSTFVLSGVGAYLLVRELTGSWRAAFLGGLLFAFAPYRIAQAGHIQVLSSQWMPLALYGFTRYLKTRRSRPLAGGAAALVLQALSCNYFLMYFTPFAVAYVIWEIARRRLWRARRMWIELAVAGAASLAVLVPFLAPYVSARDQFDMTRGREEVQAFSADVYSYFTAPPAQHVWGTRLQTYPHAEGELFPGAVPAALGLLAFIVWGVRAWRAGGQVAPRNRPLATLLGLVAASCLAITVVTIVQGRLAIDLMVATLRVRDIGRVLLFIVAAVASAAAVSPRARARIRALATVEGFFCAAIAAAWWLSLGPAPRVFGRTLDLPSPYAFLYDAVPGFDGMRVPARYAMVLSLMLAVAAAMAMARVLERRHGTIVLAALTAVFFIEAHASPFFVNFPGAATDRPAPELRVYPPSQAPAIYRTFARLPGNTVLLEMPLGDPNWDVRSVYYSMVHWRPLVNGYSGFFPRGYISLGLALADAARNDAVATHALRDSGATHLLLHEQAYPEAEVEQFLRWLNGTGARQIARDGTDALYGVNR